jgi:hypothetical protein
MRTRNPACFLRFEAARSAGWGRVFKKRRDPSRRPTRILAPDQETDLYGSPPLIHKLPATATPAAIPSAAPADGPAAATAWRRRRRRRNPDSTAAAAAAAAAAPTGVVPTAATVPRTTAPRATTPTSATPAAANISGTVEALGFDVGGNGGSSEREGRREHGGYPA